MAIEITERERSRQWSTGDNAQIVLSLLAKGSDDDAAIVEALNAYAPTVYNGLVRQSVISRAQTADENASTGLWEAEVIYGVSAPRASEVGESSFSFDTTGGIQHITQSKSTVASYAVTGTAPDFKGAIGYDGQNVAGVDIVLPVYNWNETHIFDASSIDAAYKAIVYALTSKVNSATFKGFAAGECLFLGAVGTSQGTGPVAITYYFASLPNATDLVVGDITVAAKLGWDYMWVRYKNDVDAGHPVQVPQFVYVERLYDFADLTGLSI